jgi:hypothetical protein
MNAIQKLEAELTLLNQRHQLNEEEHQRRCKQFHARQKALRKRGSALLATHRRLALSAVLERPGAVRVRYPYPPSNPCHKLNDRFGTLIEVRRTRCRVDFDGESWTFPLEYITIVESQEPHEDVSDRLVQERRALNGVGDCTEIGESTAVCPC